MTVDETDCLILELYPFGSIWYSHKFNGPGVRYEVGLPIVNGHVGWVNGPFHCGSQSDIKIFNSYLKDTLLSGEKVIAHKVYTIPSCVCRVKHYEGLSSSLLARHGTVNRRFKNFNALCTRFRHNVAIHSYFFHAVANLTQIMIEDAGPLFEAFHLKCHKFICQSM